MTAASRSTQSRRRTASALAAVAVGAVALLISLQSGAAAAFAPAASIEGAAAPAVVGAAAPFTTSAGKLTLTVDPAGGLTAAGATLKVTGGGFDTGIGIYVAICHADGKAPASLKDCVGGAIPDGNTTTSWAHISNKPGAAGGAKVLGWGAGGSFSIELTLPPSNAASDALDCAKVPCAVYTAPDTGHDAENLSVPLVYAAPVTTSSSPAVSTSSSTSPPPSSSPASSTIPSSVSTSSSPQYSTSSAVVPTTVQAKIVQSPTIVAGGLQEVLFAGFAKNEPVTVTLYSAPQALPATRADQDGVVKVDFTVPANLEPATHLLRVVGQISKVTGIASFVVTAPVVSSSASAVSSTPVSSSAAPSSAPASSAVLLPATLSSAASTTPVSSAVPLPVVPPASSGTVVWPWYALGALLVILVGVVAYLLIRRSRLAAERRDNDALLADAAAAEHQRNLDAIARANAAAPTAYLGGAAPGVDPTAPPAGGYTGYHPGEHGLLAGRDHPDSPGLLSGTGYRALPPADQPTTYLPDERTTRLPDERTTFLPGDPTTRVSGQRPPGSPGQPPAVDDATPGGPAPSGPATGTWHPTVDDATTGGPATGTWQPDFDDATTGGPATGTWQPNFDDTADGADTPPADPHTGPAGDPDRDEPDGPASGGRHSRPS